MNHPKQLNEQRLLALLVCISCFVAPSSSLFGQRVIRRTYPTYQQPPRYTPVYPSQPVPIPQPQYPIQQGPIIYSQPAPIQGGQIIDSQVVQPSVIIAPPGAQQPEPEAGNAANVKRDDEAKRLERIKRLETIKRLIAENKRLESLARDNGRQKQEVQRLERELRKATLQLSEMQTSGAPKLDDTNSETMALNGKIQQQQNEIIQLGANYQKAVQLNESLTSQVKSLSDESSNLKAQLSNQGAKGTDANQLQSNLMNTSDALNELKQRNEAMTADYNRVQGLYESTNADNATLNQRNGELSSENELLAAQLREYQNGGTLDGHLEDAQTPLAENRISRVSERRDLNMKTGLAADHGLAVSNLKRKNQRLLGLNEKAKQQNKLLNRRIAELEGTVNELTIDNKDRDVATIGIASDFDGVLSNSKQAGSSTGKYNIMSWLIPFLAIGLFVGLYVFLTEEYGGTSQAFVTGGDIRDQI